jgi:hypothetical protein
MKMKKTMLFANVLSAISAAMQCEAFVFSLSPEAPDDSWFRVRTAWPDGGRMGISIPVWMGTNQSVRIEVSGQEDY